MNSLHFSVRRGLFPLLLAALLAGCSVIPRMSSDTATPEPVSTSIAVPPAPTVEAPPPPPAPVPKPHPVKIGLALGGGAAKGFAHIGVIKVLEANGIVPEIIAGTSAGSLAGALYAAGYTGEALQRKALEMTEEQVRDLTLPNRGWIEGKALQDFVNRAVGGRPIDQLRKTLGIVVTNLKSGEQTVFRSGDTGMAVRASSAVPGVFKPVNISGSEYVDGGLTSPVPVRAVREMGADFVIAVDISARPSEGKTESTIDVMLQTFSIMGQSISRHETPGADVVIRPTINGLSSTDFKSRSRAIEAGEKAATAMLATLITRLDAARYPSNGSVARNGS
jgi:NTE family protein